MSKLNSNKPGFIAKLLKDISKSSEIEAIKVEIIKEEIINNKYKINYDNIANKMLEFAEREESEIIA
ncbi:MAG: hypothetical protein A3E88_02790 [Legionellales bacterium RIFCSPHIGHO2_12_FULL_35_11]|nr:MAG: hypothetical protein A3E88_02790 [Legionellales bacterium RIFCSPHIGHO2_12_FULL_35_11]